MEINRVVQVDNSLTIKFEEPDIKPDVKPKIKDELADEKLEMDNTTKENEKPPKCGQDSENFSREEIKKIVEIVGVEKLKKILAKLDVVKPIAPKTASRKMKELREENFRLNDKIKEQSCEIEEWKSQVKSVARQKDQLEILLEVNSSKLNLLKSEASSTKDELVSVNEAKLNRFSKELEACRDNLSLESKLKDYFSEKHKQSENLVRILKCEIERLKCQNERMKEKEGKEVESLKRKLDEITSDKEHLKCKNDALKEYVNQHVCRSLFKKKIKNDDVQSSLKKKRQ